MVFNGFNGYIINPNSSQMSLAFSHSKIYLKYNGSYVFMSLKLDMIFIMILCFLYKLLPLSETLINGRLIFN